MPKVPRFQQKITGHSKNQENLNLSKKKQSTDANIKTTQMTELAGRF